MVLIIDAQTSGLAGNMFIGAFIELGADKVKIRNVMETYAQEFGDINIDIKKKMKSGIMTTFADISTTDSGGRHYHEIIEKIDKITRDKYPDDTVITKSINLAKKIFETLAVNESIVHGKSIDEIHFHEVGCADAVADIIGSSYAYHLLGLDKEKVYTLPIAVGSGTVKTQHGILPVPAPAVMNILKDVPTVGGIVNTEIVTPTGASIVVNITDEYLQSQPQLNHKEIAYGSGKKDLESLNALRLIRGKGGVDEDLVTVLETNIDTLSGEVLGNLYDKLLGAGAGDVTITPTVMKKNRPGHIIKVIVKDKSEDEVLRVLMEETGTLGVRKLSYIHRGVAVRKELVENIPVNSSFEDVHVKLGTLGDKVIKCT
ncbi:MAG: TIGR00299 family protein, partial [Methanosphaera sp. rholeuAM74]